MDNEIKELLKVPSNSWFWACNPNYTTIYIPDELLDDDEIQYNYYGRYWRYYKNPTPGDKLDSEDSEIPCLKISTLAASNN
jgi:hypothetical protein